MRRLFNLASMRYWVMLEEVFAENPTKFGGAHFSLSMPMR